MQIRTNTASLFGQRSVLRASKTLDSSMRRLATGLRITSAKDDAAGLAISRRMTAQIRGDGQAVRNMNDGLSMLQTTEAALNEMRGSVQRLRELAVQAANDTNSLSDRRALQAEADQLRTEIQRVVEQTTFNGVEVLNGTPDPAALSGPEADLVLDLKSGWLSESERLVETYFGLVADGAELDIVIDSPGTAGGTAASVSGFVDGQGRVFDQDLNIDLADYQAVGDTYDRIIAHEMAHAVMGRTMSFNDLPLWFIEGTAEFIAGADDRLAVSIAGSSVAAVETRVSQLLGGAAWVGDSDDYSASYVAVRYLHDRIKADGGEGVKDVMDHLSSNLGNDLNDALPALPNGAYANIAAIRTEWDAGTTGADFINSLDLTNVDLGAIGGADADGGAVRSAADIVPDGAFSSDPLQNFVTIFPEGSQTGISSSETVALQVGANRGDSLEVSKIAASLARLQLDEFDLSTDPGRAINLASSALSQIAAAQGDLGASMGRLEASVRSTMARAENLSAARSRIRDADFAQETADLSKGQILRQAATSVLAQANIAPQLALQLLA